jgi:hypothetical protein
MVHRDDIVSVPEGKFVVDYLRRPQIEFDINTTKCTTAPEDQKHATEAAAGVVSAVKSSVDSKFVDDPFRDLAGLLGSYIQSSTIGNKYDEGHVIHNLDKDGAGNVADADDGVVIDAAGLRNAARMIPGTAHARNMGDLDSEGDDPSEDDP